MSLQKARIDRGEGISIAILVSATGIGTFMGALDGSIVNISLVRIGQFFGVEQSLSQWVILGYLLTIIAFLTISGYLGDTFGNKLIFQIGMLIFGLGSLLCSFAPTLGWLIAFRIIQAIGATGTMANSVAMITRFTNVQNRGTAIGWNSLIVASALSTGPILGGFLTQKLGWQSIFWINIPLSVIGFFWVQFAIPPTPPLNKTKHRPDSIGSISFALFMATLIFGFTLLVNTNINRAPVWGGVSLACSVLLILFFIFWERRVDNPIIDLNMFKNRKIAFGIFSAVLAFVGLNVITYQIPFYLQDIRLLNPSETGLTIIGVPLAMAITGPIAGKLSDKFDAKYLSTAGMLGIAIVLSMLAIFLTASLPIWSIIMVAVFMGFSIGFFTAPNGNSVMTAAPKKKLGIASGLLGLSRNVGFSLGTALSTVIFAFTLNQFQSSTGLDRLDPSVYIPSMRIMFAIFVIITIIAVVISFFRGPEERTQLPKMMENEKKLKKELE